MFSLWILMWDETWLLQRHFPHSLHPWFLSCMDSLMFHEVTVIGFLTLATFITVFLVRIFWYVETHSHYIRKALPLCGFIDECLGLTSEKKLLHTDYIHKAFPLCILWWMLRDDFLEKAFLHWLHSYGFSPVWILWWVMRDDFLEKAFPHWLHS